MDNGASFIPLLQQLAFDEVKDKVIIARAAYAVGLKKTDRVHRWIKEDWVPPCYWFRMAKALSAGTGKEDGYLLTLAKIAVHRDAKRKFDRGMEGVEP